MSYETFRHRVLHPWWTPHPLVWTLPNAPGISAFALDGKVGLFNLCWWLLDSPRPPGPAAYKAAGLNWAILTAPTLKLHGVTLTELASFKTQAEFSELLLNASRRSGKFEQHGVTWERLTSLAFKGVTL